MPFYERGDVRIYYEETGSGYPLLLIPGGGLDSNINFVKIGSLRAWERYKDEFRCIAADLRTAPSGQSTGPLEPDRPWDSFADDQLGLMDHLGIREFLVMGFCVGGPMILNLCRLAPERIVAACMMQPSGYRPEMPNYFYEHSLQGWAPTILEKRPELTMEMAEEFLTSMYTKRTGFVFSVSREDVSAIKTPLLIAPDDIDAHPRARAFEVASLVQNVEVTRFPWRDTPEHIDEAFEQARIFLRAHVPASASA